MSAMETRPPIATARAIAVAVEQVAGVVGGLHLDELAEAAPERVVDAGVELLVRATAEVQVRGAATECGDLELRGPDGTRPRTLNHRVDRRVRQPVEVTRLPVALKLSAREEAVEGGLHRGERQRL
jgi:hypothetical protein